ncbi:fatty acid--CoA ligase [Erythrobacter litoralis]|uniref:AMP-binding protein n=1 Tax=Erythrobacter litoralis TaxID=39960 RepID=UPI002436035B|nr:AMP-binding protein [Erythrobacter litoralis]MDG6079818.1 fatty acid--CoA ligase [Erythrobacter litoralis]
MASDTEPAMTIPHLALAAARDWPDDIAIVDGKRQITFAELAQEMKAAAAGFVAAGLSEGERVALWAQNSADWIVVCLGLQAAGGVLIPLNTRYREGEVADIIERSAAAMGVATEEFLGFRYADTLNSLDIPTLRKVVSLDGNEWDAFLAAGSGYGREVERRIAALSGGDLGDILFTSGTTGAPKGVMATHEQTVRTARLWANATTITHGDGFLILWPFFHCAGYKAGWVVNLAVGATTLPMAQLEVGELVDLVEREQVTFLPGPPTLFQTLLTDSAFDRDKISSVRVSITGAASVPPQLITDMRETLGIPTVLTGYGLTEACGTVTMTGPSDPPEIIVRSCGKPIEGIELKLVDEDGKVVAGSEPGRVFVRGYNVMQGYLDNPEATAEAIDPEGWLDTGDIGVMDDDGYLTITDRSKDMFISGGFNCYPAEIEAMLMAHPDIAQVAVKGIPDERLGEICAAWIIPANGSSPTDKQIVSWAREKMANFKVPRAISFVEDLPRNATGKVQKFLLPEIQQ